MKPTPQREQRPPRVVIESVRPAGRLRPLPVKRAVGDDVVVEADVFTDGHDAVRCRAALARHKAKRTGTRCRWQFARQRPLERVVPRSSARPLRVHRARPGSTPSSPWQRDLERRIEAAGQDARGRASLDRRRAVRAAPVLQGLRCAAPDRAERCATAAMALDARRRRTPSRSQRRTSTMLERRGRSGARALLAAGTSSSRARRAATRQARHVPRRERAPAVRRGDGLRRAVPAADPSDRRDERKGTNNALAGRARRCRQPVGHRRGGGRAQGDPSASSARSQDFRALVAAARARGIEIALDIAFQCAPDHPYVTRASGVVPAAPRRQRAVRREPAEEIPGHLSRSTSSRDDWRGAVGGAARASSSSGSAQGVTIFRVDNPHTKPFAFWEWVIARDQARASGADLPRRGVHAAEGDAPAGEARLHAVVHLLHLAQHASTS